MNTYYDDNDWVKNEETKQMVCKHCNLERTNDGHDPCIPNLPGVDFACCGHGRKIGYVAFSNGATIRGCFDELYGSTIKATHRRSKNIELFRQSRDEEVIHSDIDDTNPLDNIKIRLGK